MAVEVGSPAPDFTLSDHNREVVTASSLWREKNVLLVFYPFAFSTICQDEMCRVRDDIGEYANNDVQVIGVSTDTPFALKAWAEQQGYDFPLLSDFWPHGEVARKYGVLIEEAGIAMRGTFLVDTSGVVRFAEINGPREVRDQAKWKKAVAELTA
ncbi:peroxiredoxin [Saccharothrix luteola]|uniref:peroxiredoxin n=1 Tax=Saccharothrix luteola TaxID=2893018 RepID=UPI001E5A526D|nr:peroxiredoxin [Saccharothrix luteola]MCC8245911.1 peroxiredoxin [Saccharothrix luteola]MCC8248329.1 peroxiredoxin [Saccharothrix luteola]